MIIDSPDPEQRSIRLPSWDTPPPSRQYIGPKRHGYPRIRRDPLEELEARITQLERIVSEMGWPTA